MAKDQEKTLYVYGEMRSKALKELFGTIIGVPLFLLVVVFLISMAGSLFFGLGRIFTIIVFILAALIGFSTIKTSINQYKFIKQDTKKDMYQFKVTTKGIYIAHDFMKWEDITRIIAQVSRTEHKVVYRRELHDMVYVDRKKKPPVKLIAKQELFGSFKYWEFIRALVELKKEHLLKGLDEKDHKLIVKYIDQAKNK